MWQVQVGESSARRGWPGHLFLLRRSAVRILLQWPDDDYLAGRPGGRMRLPSISGKE